MIVTIVGAGRLAEGIAVRVLAGDHRVRLADAEPGKADALAAGLSARAGRDTGRPSPFVMVGGVSEAIAGADVVVLAVPYPQGRLIVRDQGAALSGVTVVDTCNPVDFTTNE
jgi:predicted dinucleotide-binding enzyme